MAGHAPRASVKSVPCQANAVLRCRGGRAPQTYYSTRDELTNRYKPHALKGEEVAVVEQVGAGGWHAVLCLWA
jgi:hypothetical protein